MTSAKKIIILLGDILILYGALMLTLIFRYGLNYFGESFHAHFKPFSLIFVIWILIFYLADLYKKNYLKINLATVQVFILTIIIGVISSVILFYLFPSFFKLTPKANLVIFALIFGILDLGWRFILVKIYISGGWRNRLLVIGDSPIINEVINYLKNNPQVGYDIVVQIKEYSDQKMIKNINQIIARDKINTIIILSHLKKDPEIVKVIYRLLSSEIAIMDFITFYEIIFQKLLLEELEKNWFIEKIITKRHLFNFPKRLIDLILAFIFGAISFPIGILATVLIKITSSGPVIYKQRRIGKNEKEFTLYKFRTMKVDAEKNGAQWANKDDPRATPIGRFLRRTHLDELPQLLNIIKGDISFVGPRPERPEFVNQLKKEIPYYEIRHLIKPGLTGWAQINYRYGASIKETSEKLSYDIYYIKNRSLILDLLIIIKTIRLFFKNP